MRLRLPVWLSWSLLVFGVGSWVAAFLVDSPPYATPADATWGISFIAVLVVGFFLTLRIRSNAVGWLIGLGAGLAGAGVALDEAGISVLGDGVFELALLVSVTALYLFPDGRFPPPLWRAIYLASLAALLVVAPLTSPQAGASLGSIALATLIAGAMGSMLHRAARGGPVVRRQIGLPILVVVLGLAIILVAPLLSGPQSNAGPLGDWVAVIPSLVLTVGFPISLGVSISRYRLYDIDRLVSRTVTYALVLGLLGLVILGSVTLLTIVLPSDDPLVVGVSTLAAASLFNPVRRRIQAAVERRFNRSRYDAERVIEGFTGTLRERVDPDRVLDGWVGVVSETMQPSAVGAWLR